MIIHLLVNKLVKNIVADTASSQLCKVNSCNKQQQATTPSAIAMDAIKVTTNHNGGDWCHHCEASKLLQNKPLECDEKRPWQSATEATSGLANERNKNFVRAPWASQQFSSRDDNNYCHISVYCRDACTSRQTGGPSSTRSLEQIGQMHALDLLQRERQDQGKQKCKQQWQNYV